MNFFYLSYQNLIAKPLQTFFQVLLLALGTGLIFALLLAERQFSAQLSQNLKGIDMVVGAKGSPLQLILANIYHLDNPTGNIPLAEWERLRKNRLVKKAIPLGYGDSYKGFRIVGTDSSYLTHYEIIMQEGNAWNKPFEVVIGAEVAAQTGLKIGNTFESVHGLVENEDHHEHPYRVVGIMTRKGTVTDRLILTSLESIWEVHTEHPENEVDSTKKEITAVLLTFRNPMAAVMLPRQINEKTQLQAASPAYEMNRLLGLLGIGIEWLEWLGIGLMGIAGLSIWISLYQSLEERKYEIAILRTLGASRWQIARILFQESLFLSIVGLGIGFLLSRLIFVFLAQQVGQIPDLQILTDWTETENYLAVSTLGLSLLASLMPAYRAFQMQITQVLAEN